MASLVGSFIPIIFGLLLLTTIGRALTFWQKERTARVFSFMLVFLSLSVLYLVVALGLPVQARDIARTFLLVALLVGTWLDWQALIGFMHKKYERKVVALSETDAPPPTTTTLATLADEHGPVKLNATEVGEVTEVSERIPTHE